MTLHAFPASRERPRWREQPSRPLVVARAAVETFFSDYATDEARAILQGMLDDPTRRDAAVKALEEGLDDAREACHPEAFLACEHLLKGTNDVPPGWE